jgi:xanthine dehydrogenase molybdopterin-binding subunit B
MPKDVRKEQLELIKFERKLAGLAAFVAAGSATAASAADKINAEATAKAYYDIRIALVNLADVTTQAHQALQENVLELGARALQVGGGMPKATSSEVVRSILGIG